MTSLEPSTDPTGNANVFASAGSGKTWLLITRICRLMLAGASPQHILAITFTRKSAADMRLRLDERLARWATISESELITELQSIGESTSKQRVTRARQLYEQVLFSEQKIRITTFHAFCEEVVRAFPLESELPAMFEITEQTHSYSNQAFKNLLQLSERQNETELTDALHTLHEFCFGINNTKKALLSFLEARNDWRVFTADSTDPIKFARDTLEQILNVENDSNSSVFSSTSELIDKLANYSNALKSSGTKTRIAAAEKVDHFVRAHSKATEALPLHLIKSVFLTEKLEPRELKIGKKWQTTLGEHKTAELRKDHAEICTQIVGYLDTITRENYEFANRAWFYAGDRFLQCFQEEKYKIGIVDFNDLEWETFRLLQQQDHALWVQYKLGERIKHFLVDEFQDTNPIQWQLLRPLIESSHEQHQHEVGSLFLVGDVKQSIYRFRGANPEIQHLAANWAHATLQSQEYSNNHSWRSAPAIIECVNQVFAGSKLLSFQTHHVQHEDYWGFVELHPLTKIKRAEINDDFRDPLHHARSQDESTAHFHEGLWLAERIEQLIDDQTPIYNNGSVRPVKYGDILVLTRTRSHVNELTAGLRSRSIPVYVSESERLITFLEIKDLIALLNCLIDPYNDLALTHALRSPIFSIDNADLIKLRHLEFEFWHQKLAFFITSIEQEHPLKTAYIQLNKWRELADKIPVHDLLSHIYASWNLIDRYKQATYSTEALQIANRLTQFLHLSLEIDSGRYSSIARFLRKLQEYNPEAQISTESVELDAIKFMTVHGAKGLEAPIVFLADSGPLKSPPEQYASYVQWPAENPSPELIMLSCKQSLMPRSASRIKEQNNNATDESLNLLYVALTRAKQILIISGVEADQNKQDCWHAFLTERLNRENNEIKRIEKGQRPKPVALEISTTNIRKAPNVNLFQAIPPNTINKISAPNNANEASKQGIIIHKCLELLSERRDLKIAELNELVGRETGLTISMQELKPLYEEALNCITHENTARAFQIHAHSRALNEIAIAHQTTERGTAVNVIDRLIIDNETAWIIDYKTERDVSIENASELLNNHQNQLRRYANSVAALYPSHQVKCSILFTKLPLLLDLAE